MPVSLTYIAKRVLQTVAVVFGVITIVFIVTRVIPAHPEFLWAGPHATDEQLRKAREILHLDEPIYIQYIYYLQLLAKGDLGVSWRTRNPVLQDILAALPATLELTIAGFCIGVVVGLLLGVSAALRYNNLIDRLVRVLSVAGSAVPPFWLALIFQLVFSIWLNILPGGYRMDPTLQLLSGFKPITGFYTIDTLLMGRIDLFVDVVKRLVMPSLVISIYPMMLTARMARSLVLESLQEDYVRNLRSWGVSDRAIIRRYILRAVMPPIIASLGLSFGYTLVGAFLIEIIFSWNGLGSYMASSLLSYDYPAIIGGLMIIAIIYSVINTVVDIVQAHIDPRVRL